MGTIESLEYEFTQTAPLEPVTLTNKSDGRVTVLPVALVDELAHDGEFLGDRPGHPSGNSYVRVAAGEIIADTPLSPE